MASQMFSFLLAHDARFRRRAHNRQANKRRRLTRILSAWQDTSVAAAARFICDIYVEVLLLAHVPVTLRYRLRTHTPVHQFVRDLCGSAERAQMRDFDQTKAEWHTYTHTHTHVEHAHSAGVDIETHRRSVGFGISYRPLELEWRESDVGWRWCLGTFSPGRRAVFAICIPLDLCVRVCIAIAGA